MSNLLGHASHGAKQSLSRDGPGMYIDSVQEYITL